MKTQSERTTWLISDTHFSHPGICKFLREDGTKLRPFDDVKVMDEALMDNWNSVVKPHDKLYHIGDIALNDHGLELLHRLNGVKILIKGNHDRSKLRKYLGIFKDVRGSHDIDKYLLTHIPIHPLSKGRWRGNIHGHLHANKVTFENGNPDPWYLCVCVEHTNYTPISWEDTLTKFQAQQP